MKLIVWDIDDVLNELMRVWFEEHWQPCHSECRISYREITANPPHEVLGIPEAEYLASLDEFRASEAARAMVPNPKVLEWFRDHGKDCRHVALTARPMQSAAGAAEWLFRHFGPYIRTFSVVPSRLDARFPAFDRTKGEFLNWLGKPGVLIDDSEANIEAARALGLTGLLYPQPWNSSRLSVDETLALLGTLVSTNAGADR